MSDSESPRSRGFRLPAEWEPHAATWVSWPHKEASWPGKIETIKPVFATMVAELSRSETVHVNVNDTAMEDEARRLLADCGPLGEIVFHHFPTNDAWCRDHGAIFVTRPADHPDGPAILATDWKYNAWGDKYPPYDRDNRIPASMAEFLGVERVTIPMVLEGGSIDTNGQGALLTTESCLLNPNRNPDMSRGELETALREHLGVVDIFWLGDGIVGDDTDGHIDDITRFVNTTTVITAVETDRDDENFAPLQENLERLQSFRLQTGEALQVVELPMPRAVVFEDQRLPASYANFYIANSVVLLPFYGGPRDDEARQILQALFPNRRIVGIDCSDLIWGLGAFHCLTQQVPAKPIGE